MANNDHVKLLEKGSGVWNAWREENPDIEPDLGAADLRRANLSGVKLYGANLSQAHLRGSNLSEAEFMWSNLTAADLKDTNHRSADLRRSKLGAAKLQGADLTSAQLRSADFRKANLRRAKLGFASLFAANLGEADLREAGLAGANLNEASLYAVNLCEGNLLWASLSGKILSGADLSGAILGWTTFADNDLSTVKGLETVSHKGPSRIGIDTLLKSDGKIPEVFLRGAGVPEDFITFVPSLIGCAIEFYSCFISYSHQDEEFSRRLYSRMRSENLRVWYAPEDMKRGRKLHEEIFRAIQVHDKLLLVLSEHSMKSEWVATEIRRAKKVEREENRCKLFPIRLVDFEAIQNWECFDADDGKDLGVEVREYYIPDFSNWKDHDAFEAEFGKLLRDLKPTEG
jgi:uncharacterized protein YjbI with pentapeptide repeats